MKEQTTAAASPPRFDVFLTAAENRRDDWQRLQALAQAAGIADDSGARSKLAREAQELLARLDVLESLWAYPGPVLMQKLRERIAGDDAAGSADLARRLAKAVLGGTYRGDERAWSDSVAEDAAERKSRAPTYGRDGQVDRLYMEVLVVAAGTPADQERVRRE